MSNSILVTYASRYGSTQEVAESIADTLRKGGLVVDTKAMRDVRTLDNYDAIVLGAAIYNARWHPDAHGFVTQYQTALSQRPVAVFALGPLSPSAAAMRRSRGQLDKELRKYRWFKPVTVEMFAGRIDPSKLGRLERLLIPTSDHRDWEAIHVWASALPVRLQGGAVLSRVS